MGVWFLLTTIGRGLAASFLVFCGSVHRGVLVARALTMTWFLEDLGSKGALFFKGQGMVSHFHLHDFTKER